jgi:hypothetical protein
MPFPPAAGAEQKPRPPAPTPTPAAPPAPAAPSRLAPTPPEPLRDQGILELYADNQSFDQNHQVFTATGNVKMRFGDTLLTGDRLQVNLLNRFAVAEGNVSLTRGQQVLLGNRFEYNFVQGEGTVSGVRGDIFLPTASEDFAPPLPTNISAGTNLAPLVNERIYANQPPQDVTSTGGITSGVGAQGNRSGGGVVPPTGGTIRRIRFEADSAQFYPEGWLARGIRITNDPFSPPELELQAEQAQLTRISPAQDEILLNRPRLVFDQRLRVPIWRKRVVLDRRERQPGLVQFGYDSEDRGGFFIQRNQDLLSSSSLGFSIAPQFYLQRAIDEGLGLSSFGFNAQLQAPLSPQTTIRGRASLTSLRLRDFDQNFRGSLQAQSLIGTHGFNVGAVYRARLFNNSLGFQNVQYSAGAVLNSPAIALGQSGINLSYQLNYQYANANTDDPKLLKPNRSNDRVSLSRFQASTALSRGFLLWQGKPLPATPEAGMRYTPLPLVPYLNFNVGLNGAATAYSDGQWQNTLTATVGLTGQFGHSSRRFFDYTAFNITYSRVFLDGLSPFLFDRVADTTVLFAGITQQLYGPLRIGIQTAWNVSTNQEISTDYVLEYSRRTYNVLLRYNPVLQLGSLSLRIGDFNWRGGSTPFSGSNVTFVGVGGTIGQ